MVDKDGNHLLGDDEETETGTAVWLERSRKLGQTFTPSRPVKSKEIFSGRIQQLRDALSIVEQGGLHALLFGERGVGKTSMANIIQILAQEPDEGHLAIKVECTSSDTFRSIIAGFYREIYIERAIQEVVGFHRSRQPST